MSLDGDKDKGGWTTSSHHPPPPAWGQVGGWGMKTNRSKEGHDGNPHLGRFKLLHTHPVCTSSSLLSQGSACQLVEPRKAAKRCTGMHRDRGRSSRSGPQLPRTPKHHDPSNKLFASGGMWHVWLLLQTFVASHKSTIRFWKVWKAVMYCLLFFLPTWAYVLRPRSNSTAKDTGTALHDQKNQPSLYGWHCLQAVISRHHVLNPHKGWWSNC